MPFPLSTDPDPGWPCAVTIGCVWAFWALPFVLRVTGRLRVAAFLSVELLAFTALFGTFFYGGASSFCLPWIFVALLLGFFSFPERPGLVAALFAVNLAAFFALYARYGFPEIVPVEERAPVNWVSIASATLTMAWMANAYASVMSRGSQIERETERSLAATAQLKAVKEMAEAADRARTIFLARMSHELRTPLSAVIGYSELILENLSADDPRQRDVQSINAAGRHLLSLVIDVLDLSKIESETLNLAVATFALDGLIEQALATVRPIATANGNALHVVGPPPGQRLTTDETKLRQILVNLLGNAAKFTRDGSVTLAMRLDRKPVGTWLDVEVRDTGIGIAEADLARLFKPFGQVSATAQGYGGSGLGLALSQTLCARLGGRITVSSEPGRGSVFGFRIPAAIAGDVRETGVPNGERGLVTAAAAPV